jgi:L-lactate dehydrogenase (cytochrome)
MNKLDKVLCLKDFEVMARRHLPKPIFGYIAGASEDNLSYEATLASFSRLSFVPRTLVDISQRTSSTSLFGQTYTAPFGIAPMGISALSAYRGDIALARAAKAAGVPMIMSGSSLIRLEEVAEANPHAWFQAYLPGEVERIVALIERMKATSFRTLVITVDASVNANRENNIRNGFSTPLRPSLRLASGGLTHPSWLFGTFLRTLIMHGMPHFENSYAHRGAPILSQSIVRDISNRGHLTWRHFKIIRSIWPGTLVVKGILHPDDARKAVDAGADGIIVSNHGGRQLDGTVAPLLALPGVMAAVPDTAVMLDGGVRRGGDVLKAIALGARFVFVGRPFGYAAAVSGEAGVLHALKLLSEEVLRNMGMLGLTSISEVTRECLFDAEYCGGRGLPGETDLSVRWV